jgi:hypothetical protein
MSLWTPGQDLAAAPLIKRSKAVKRSFRGPDGKWRVALIEETEDAHIAHIERDDGRIDAVVEPKTYFIKFQGS